MVNFGFTEDKRRCCVSDMEFIIHPTRLTLVKRKNTVPNAKFEKFFYRRVPVTPLKAISTRQSSSSFSTSITKGRFHFQAESSSRTSHLYFPDAQKEIKKKGGGECFIFAAGIM